MMGQHKHNPTAITAANGMFPPKPKKLDKRESKKISRINDLGGDI